MNIFEDSPIIIIGMHRSGTTMIAEMLTQLGLFQGLEKDPNHEPLFFMEINDWLLRTAGGAWDHPLPFKLLVNNKAVLVKAVHFIRERLQTRPAVSFFGRSYRSIRAKPAAISGPWGWKDPRNTITLPVWLKIFPKAKVIHIGRHGVDVAASLLHRNDKELRVLLSEKEGLSRRNRLFMMRPSIVKDSIRCSTLEGGFSVWEEYMNAADEDLKLCGEQGMDVRYEDFIASPEHFIEKLAAFCGLNCSKEALTAVAKTARTSRAFSFQADRDLSLFADSVAARLANYGY